MMIRNKQSGIKLMEFSDLDKILLILSFSIELWSINKTRKE